jgi:predicted phage terminase large subunit-like protein
VGVKGAIRVDRIRIRDLKEEKDQIPEIVSVYIDDIVRLREEAPKRNRVITNTAIKDGYECTQFIESVAGYKDCYTTLKTVLSGISTVRTSTLPGDKITKVSVTIEVPFENCKVFVNRKIHPDILEEFFKCLKGFPSIEHDDDADALTIMVAGAKENIGVQRYRDTE